jgi:hypothetical protein
MLTPSSCAKLSMAFFGDNSTQVAIIAMFDLPFGLSYQSS